MTVLKGVLRDVLSSVTRSVLLADDAITRFFTTLASAGSMHYVIPTVTLTGDYKITSLVYFTGLNIDSTGNTADTRSRVKIDSAGAVLWRPSTATTTASSATGVVPLNKLSIIEVERIGSAGTIKVNGVTVFNSTVPTTSCIVNAIGNSSGVSSSGIAADVAIDDAGTPIRFYAIDEDLATTSTIVDSISGQNGTAINISESDLFTLQSNGDYLGVERLTNLVGSGSATEPSAGVFDFNVNASEAADVRQNITLTIGDIYRSEFVVSNYVDGDLAANFYGFTGLNITGDGNVAFDSLPATSADWRLTRFGASVHMTISRVSSKQLLEKA